MSMHFSMEEGAAAAEVPSVLQFLFLFCDDDGWLLYHQREDFCNKFIGPL